MRVLIRLGADVFVNGNISEYIVERIRDTMKAFYLLMKSHGIVNYKVFATSAMREASGGEIVCKLID